MFVNRYDKTSEEYTARCTKQERPEKNDGSQEDQAKHRVTPTLGAKGETESDEASFIDLTVYFMAFAPQMPYPWIMSPYAGEPATASRSIGDAFITIRSSEEEHRVDALALRADERRDKLRKAAGSCK